MEAETANAEAPSWRKLRVFLDADLFIGRPGGRLGLGVGMIAVGAIGSVAMSGHGLLAPAVILILIGAVLVGMALRTYRNRKVVRKAIVAFGRSDVEMGRWRDQLKSDRFHDRVTAMNAIKERAKRYPVQTSPDDQPRPA